MSVKEPLSIMYVFDSETYLSSAYEYVQREHFLFSVKRVCNVFRTSCTLKSRRTRKINAQARWM